MPRCKPGQHAYITQSDVPSQNGMVVKVERMNVEFSRRHAMVIWDVSFSGVVVSPRDGILIGEGAIRDALLRPITGSGPVVDEDASEDLRVKEPACHM